MNQVAKPFRLKCYAFWEPERISPWSRAQRRNKPPKVTIRNTSKHWDHPRVLRSKVTKVILDYIEICTFQRTASCQWLASSRTNLRSPSVRVRSEINEFTSVLGIGFPGTPRSKASSHCNQLFLQYSFNVVWWTRRSSSTTWWMIVLRGLPWDHLLREDGCTICFGFHRKQERSTFNLNKFESNPRTVDRQADEFWSNFFAYMSINDSLLGLSRIQTT
jgi:hypothetical protein